LPAILSAAIVQDKAFSLSGWKRKMPELNSNQRFRRDIHFRIHRIIQYLDFYIHYPYHRILHCFNPFGDDPTFGTVRGSIVCECGYVNDLGYSYGMHCEECYNHVTWLLTHRENNYE